MVHLFVSCIHFRQTNMERFLVNLEFSWNKQIYKDEQLHFNLKSANNDATSQNKIISENRNFSMSASDGLKSVEHEMNIPKARRSVLNAVPERNQSQSIKIRQEKHGISQLTSNSFEEVIFVSDDIAIDTFDYVLSETQWLSDAHIDLAIESWINFRSKYKHMPYCRIPTVLKMMELERHNLNISQSFEPQIYFAHANNNHWYILTNINNNNHILIETEKNGAIKQNYWYIYDSLNNHSPENVNAAKKILHKIYPDKESVFVNLVNVIQQRNTNDCGLYAIAYAQTLLAKREPSVLMFDETSMRKCYNNFVSRKWLKEFKAFLIPEAQTTAVRMELFFK